MVSPQNPSQPGTVPGIETTGRGFITADEAAIARPEQAQATFAPHSYVAWGAVLAGSLLALGLLTISSQFAYAVGVPAYSGGVYGWGAGIWAVISSIICFYAGGLLSALMTPNATRLSALLHGVAAWFLSIPLLLLIWSGSFGPPMNHFASVVASNVTRMTLSGGPAQPTWGAQTGAAWGSLLALFLGLIAAAAGGLSRSMRRRDISG